MVDKEKSLLVQFEEFAAEEDGTPDLIASRLEHIAGHLTASAAALREGDGDKADSELLAGGGELDEFKRMLHVFLELQTLERLTERLGQV